MGGGGVAEDSGVAVGAGVGESAAGAAEAVDAAVAVALGEADVGAVATFVVGVGVDLSDEPPQAANAAAETAMKQSTRMRTNTLRRRDVVRLCGTNPSVAMARRTERSGRYLRTGRRLE